MKLCFCWGPTLQCVNIMVVGLNCSACCRPALWLLGWILPYFQSKEHLQEVTCWVDVSTPHLEVSAYWMNMLIVFAFPLTSHACLESANESFRWIKLAICKDQLRLGDEEVAFSFFSFVYRDERLDAVCLHKLWRGSCLKQQRAAWPS